MDSMQARARKLLRTDATTAQDLLNYERKRVEDLRGEVVVYEQLLADAAKENNADAGEHAMLALSDVQTELTYRLGKLPALERAYHSSRKAVKQFS